MARTIIDLSHRIEAGMVTNPGMPVPEFFDHLTRDEAERVYAPGVRFHIGRISMIANTGTYIDSPFHRYDDATDLSGLAMNAIADVPGVVVRVANTGRRAIDVADLEHIDVKGRAVLIHTNWAQHWRTERYGIEARFLTAAATQWLVDQGAALVGIDSLNVDDIGDPQRPAHSGLLGAGIPIVEHMCALDAMPDDGFRFHAAPPAVVGFGTFPVRAYAVIE
jgi:arylformamidase